MSVLPLTGAGSDRTLKHASPLFAARAFVVVKKPVQASQKFGKGKIRTLQIAMKPPIEGGLRQERFDPGDSF